MTSELKWGKVVDVIHNEYDQPSSEVLQVQIQIINLQTACEMLRHQYLNIVEDEIRAESSRLDSENDDDDYRTGHRSHFSKSLHIDLNDGKLNNYSKHVSIPSNDDIIGSNVIAQLQISSGDHTNRQEIDAIETPKRKRRNSADRKYSKLRRLMDEEDHIRDKQAEVPDINNIKKLEANLYSENETITEKNVGSLSDENYNVMGFPIPEAHNRNVSMQYSPPCKVLGPAFHPPCSKRWDIMDSPMKESKIEFITNPSNYLQRKGISRQLKLTPQKAECKDNSELETLSPESIVSEEWHMHDEISNGRIGRNILKKISSTDILLKLMEDYL